MSGYLASRSFLFGSRVYHPSFFLSGEGNKKCGKNGENCGTGLTQLLIFMMLKAPLTAMNYLKRVVFGREGGQIGHLSGGFCV